MTNMLVFPFNSGPITPNLKYCCALKENHYFYFNILHECLNSLNIKHLSYHSCIEQIIDVKGKKVFFFFF